jgi:hypothetical protein
MKRIALVLAMAALIASPASAQQRCITTPEAEAMALVALPDLMRQTGIVCVGRLPAASSLRNPQSRLIGRYEAEAVRAWPVARGAIVKLSDPAVDALLDSEFARPLLTSLLVPLLVGRIAPADCGAIDRLVSLLEPLPPRNTAGIVVATLQYLKAKKAKGDRVSVPDLPLCTAEAP